MNTFTKPSLRATFLASFCSPVLSCLGALDPVVVSGEKADYTERFLYFARQVNSHHSPISFMSRVRRDFGERGISFTTSTQPADLNLENFNQYHGVFFFGNHGTLLSATSIALDTYLRNGGGMVGMHVMAYVARENIPYRAILGGAFRGHHSAASFTSTLIQSNEDYPTNLSLHPDFPFDDGGTYAFDPRHPILEELEPYTSVDEPYLHQYMAQDIVLLGIREDHGGWAEPYTWVRHHGTGRVFYHANGHDWRTWNEPNFRELMIRGTSWVSKEEQREYQTLHPAAINGAGEIQYLGISGDPVKSDLSLYSNLEESAQDGGQVPGGNEALDYVLNSTIDHAFLDNGQIVFSPGISQGGVELSALMMGHRRYPQLVAVEGGAADALEAGFTFSSGQSFPFTTNSRDAVVFQARIEDSAGGNQKETIAMCQDESLSPVLIEGDPVPGLPSHTVVSIPDQLVHFDSSGRIAVVARLSEGQNPSETHLLGGQVGVFSSWLKSNQGYSGLPANTVVAGFLRTVSVSDNKLIFTARLGGPLVNVENDDVIAYTDAGGEVGVLLREGDLLESSPVTFPGGDPLPQMQGNKIIVPVIIDGSNAIATVGHDQTPVILVKEGQSVVSNEGVFSIESINLESIMVSPTQVVLVADLLSSDLVTQSSALLQIGSGMIRPLIMENQNLVVAGGSFSVASISCQGTTGNGGGLNPNGQLVALVTSPELDTALIRIENLDDFDGDGISDTIETAFGGGPESGNIDRPPGYPRLVKSADGTMSFLYWRHSSPASPLSYQVQKSHNLVDWENVALETSVSADQAGVPAPYERMMAVIPATGDQTFYRFIF